jgi:hypothetical protein
VCGARLGARQNRSAHRVRAPRADRLAAGRGGRDARRELGRRDRLRVHHFRVCHRLRGRGSSRLEACRAARHSRRVDVRSDCARSSRPRNRACRARPPALVRHGGRRARHGLFPKPGLRSRLRCVGRPFRRSPPNRGGRRVRVDGSCRERRRRGGVHRRQRVQSGRGHRRVGRPSSAERCSRRTRCSSGASSPRLAPRSRSAATAGCSRKHLSSRAGRSAALAEECGGAFRSTRRGARVPDQALRPVAFLGDAFRSVEEAVDRG